MPLSLRFERTGPPEAVLSLDEIPLADLRPSDVRVSMRYAPINPADLNFIEGTYGRVPNLPAVPGIEGIGNVVELGASVSRLKLGDLVIALRGGGIWAQSRVADESMWVKVPATIDPVQACMLRINPVTAWRLLHDYVSLQPGEWIVQNAANSGVGRALIQIAKTLGYRTANFVRRPELFDELRSLGGDAFFVDNEEGISAAREQLSDQPILLATNAVGGDSALRQLDLLSPHGVQVTYGAMSRRSIKVPNKHLIFKDISLRGHWVTRWLEQAKSDEVDSLIRALAQMMIAGTLKIAIDCVVPLSEYQSAIARAQQAERDGKVIFDLQS